MEQPLFTIATITYNSAKYVRQAIESVLASSFTDFEYLISDDCSTDHTWEIIQEYKDPRIRAWRNTNNLGEYPNRNKVLREAKGKYILYIDGDDILSKYGLTIVKESLNVYPNIAMVMANFYHDGIVYPCKISPSVVAQYEFLGNSLLIHGFTNTVFNSEVLKMVGGLPHNYIAGDRYIKLKLALKFDTLVIHDCIAWWRATPGQASEKLQRKDAGFWELMQMWKEFLKERDIPLTEADKILATKRLQRNALVRMIRKSFFTLGFFKSLQLLKRLDIRISSLLLIFHSFENRLKIPHSAANPLIDSAYYSPAAIHLTE